MEARVGIYETEDGLVDVQIYVGNLYFEFGADNAEKAQEVIDALKNAKVAINP